MTKEEYWAIVNKKYSEVAKLKKEIEELTVQYCNDNAPFKIGDKVRINWREGIITSIEPYGDDFYYKWRPFNKDGSKGDERCIWIYDMEYMKKVED